MVLNDLERQLASLQTQYTNAVNSLGQAQVGEKIEVMSKGQRFTLIEAPFDRNAPVSPQRLLISAPASWAASARRSASSCSGRC